MLRVAPLVEADGLNVAGIYLNYDSQKNRCPGYHCRFFCMVCGIAFRHEELLQIAAGVFNGFFAGDYRLGGVAVCFTAVSGERCKS